MYVVRAMVASSKDAGNIVLMQW